MLSFVIATRDRRDSLARCLESIDAQSHPDREAIVVVDGSTDGTVEMLAQQFPAVRCVHLTTSAGVGNALHEGSLVATGDVLVNLDDDAALISSEAAADLAHTLTASSEFDVVCMRVEAPDGSVRHREIPLRSKKMPTINTEIGYFLGGAVAFRKTALSAAGGYPRAIGYGSWENDVAFRMFKTGARTLFTPGIRVVHYAIPSKQNSDMREANYVRNEILIAARFLPAPYAQVHAALWTGLCLAQATAHGHLGRTVSAVARASGEWFGVRRDREFRLTSAEARRLSRLSGRTWY